jgi:hypothetical protein
MLGHVLDDMRADQIVIVDDHEKTAVPGAEHARQHPAALVGAERVVELFLGGFAEFVQVIWRKGDAYHGEPIGQRRYVGAFIGHDDAAPIPVGLVGDRGDSLDQIGLQRFPVASIVLVADRNDECDEWHMPTPLSGR